MRIVDTYGAVYWMDGHDMDDAYDAFGPIITIKLMWAVENHVGN